MGNALQTLMDTVQKKFKPVQKAGRILNKKISKGIERSKDAYMEGASSLKNKAKAYSKTLPVGKNGIKI